MASIFLLCSGCASHTQAVRQRLKVLIVSQPAGAKIEINGQYVGDAPLTVEIEASNDGRFWKDTIIKAYPKDTGYIQIKAFNGKSRWAISDMVPPSIFFDTRDLNLAPEFRATNSFAALRSGSPAHFLRLGGFCHRAIDQKGRQDAEFLRRVLHLLFSRRCES